GGAGGRAGGEAGAGGWLAMPRWRVWASAPQVWRARAAPPLARGLALGAAFSNGGLTAALERQAPRRGFAESAAYRASLTLTAGFVSAWAEARDRPWRGALGLAARLGPLLIAGEAES